MESLQVLEYHMFFCHICGLWPSPRPSYWYWLYSYAFITVILIGCCAISFISLPYVDSVDQIVDNLIINSSLIMTSIKGVNVLIQRKKITKLFEKIHQLDEKCSETETILFRNVLKESRILFKIFMSAYMFSYVLLVSQSVFSAPGKGLWASTYFFPFEWARNVIIYRTVFAHQAISCFIIAIIDAICDTYVPILCHIIGGHIDVLSHRLKSIGWTSPDNIYINVDVLRNCIETHKQCSA